MKSKIYSTAIAAALALLSAGCASGDGGQIAAGILQGIGQGLSGL